MTSQTTPTVPRRMTEFAGHNGQFAGGTRVHEVAEQPWIDDLQVPGPACNTGSGSFDPGVFRPVHAAVTCRRCQRKHGTPQPPTVDDDPDQLDMFDPDPEEETPDATQ